MDHVAVFLEHVDLLDGLDGLHVHLLKSGLQLLVVGTGGLVDLLDLAAGSTLASVRMSLVGLCAAIVRSGSVWMKGEGTSHDRVQLEFIKYFSLTARRARATWLALDGNEYRKLEDETALPILPSWAGLEVSGEKSSR